MLLPTDPRAHHSRPPPSPSSHHHHLFIPTAPCVKKTKSNIYSKRSSEPKPLQLWTPRTPLQRPTTPYKLLRSTSRSFVSSSIIALIVPTYSQVTTSLPHVTDSCHRLRFRARHHQHQHHWAESLSACLRHTQSPSSCASALRGCL